jgi:hypothetical protein
MANIIPKSTDAAVSADFTLTDGQTTTLFLSGGTNNSVDPAALALIQIKAGTEYFTVARLDVTNPGLVLQAPGTFRVQKRPSPVNIGVERE